MSSYFLKSLILGTKTRILVSQIKKIQTIITNSEIEAFLLEAEYIKKYRPKYNVKLTDDKAYPLIKITIKEPYPKVLIVRRREKDSTTNRSIYFGPFPNAAGTLRMVLRTVRKIFPYQSTPNHAKKICLYYHLGLCPCPPVFASEQFRKDYRKNIKHLIDFLKGKTRKVLSELRKERSTFSKNEKFEKAQELQNKINAIELITGPSYRMGIDRITPELNVDIREREISNLMLILNRSNLKIENLKRIECFDVSNISGTNATGSMVTFTNGEKDGSWYRKFKIRSLDTPNDFAMIKEVLQRRIKHKEWPTPSLIIVDGGKGQVSAALKTMKQFNNLTIPIIGLAKKEETIITPDLKEVCLPKNSDALKLVMRIRDEAHRFAITYHRHLRSKSLLS